MNDRERRSLSRFLSRILRHEPELVGISLDDSGWADTAALLAGVRRAGYTATIEDLQVIVATNDKQRFKFSEDHSLIRANQGHSIPVNLDLEVVPPPEILFHGTATKFLTSIRSKGILPGSRLHVHLSGDVETAIKVGRRHGEPVVLVIAAARMAQEGHIFHLSANGVWLTASVPSAYLIE